MIGKNITLNGTTKSSKSQDKSVAEISPSLISIGWHGLLGNDITPGNEILLKIVLMVVGLISG